MSKWNQEERIYCIMEEMQKMGCRLTENMAMMAVHLSDMEKTMAYLEVCQALSRQFVYMTEGVMEMANLSEKYQVRESEPFLLGHFFISMINEIWEEAEKKQQRFLPYNGGIVHEQVIGDFYGLNKACKRILDNAVKHTKEGGTITVRLMELPSEEKAQGHYQLQVNDSGRGMLPEEITKALSPYPEGGFGLSVAEGIFSRLGGSMQIESAVGIGTTVTADFFLKLQNTFPSGEGELLGRRILIFEEKREEKEDSKRLFMQLGADCTLVCSRDCFEEQIGDGSQWDYDMVIIDRDVISEDLADFLKNIRSKVGSQTYIILISSHSNEEISYEVMVAGADGYIQRPLFCTGLHALLKGIETIRRL